MPKVVQTSLLAHRDTGMKEQDWRSLSLLDRVETFERGWCASFEDGIDVIEIGIGLDACC